MLSQNIVTSNPQATETKTAFPDIPALNQYDMIPAITTRFAKWAMELFDLMIQDKSLETSASLEQACIALVPELGRTRRSAVTPRHNIQLAVIEHGRKENSAIKLSKTLLALEELVKNKDKYLANVESSNLVVEDTKPVAQASVKNSPIDQKKSAKALIMAELKTLAVKKNLKDRNFREKISALIPGSTADIGYNSAANHYRYHLKVHIDNLMLSELQLLKKALSELNQSIQNPAPEVETPEKAEKNEIIIQMTEILVRLSESKALIIPSLRKDLARIIPGSESDIDSRAAKKHFICNIQKLASSKDLQKLKEIQAELDTLNQRLTSEKLAEELNLIASEKQQDQQARNLIYKELKVELSAMQKKAALKDADLLAKIAAVVIGPDAKIDIDKAAKTLLSHIKDHAKKSPLDQLKAIRGSLAELNLSIVNPASEAVPVDNEAKDLLIKQLQETLNLLWTRKALLVPDFRKSLSEIIPGPQREIDVRQAKPHFLRCIRKLNDETDLQKLSEILTKLQKFNQDLNTASLQKLQHRIREEPFHRSKPLSEAATQVQNLIDEIVTEKFLNIRGNRSSLLALIPGAVMTTANKNLKRHFQAIIVRLNETASDDEMLALESKLIAIRDGRIKPAVKQAVTIKRLKLASHTSRSSGHLESSLNFRETKRETNNDHKLKLVPRFPEDTEKVNTVASGFNFLGKDAFSVIRQTVADWSDLPEEQMLDVLNRPCDFYPRSRIYNTHLLAFIPESIAEKPLTMESALEILNPDFSYGLPQLVRGEQVYPDIICKNESFFKTATKKGHWILMPLEVPKSREFENYEVADAREVLIAASVYQRYANREIFGGRIGCTSDFIVTDKGNKYVSVGSSAKKLSIAAFSLDQINSPMSVRVGWALKRKLPF